MRRPGHAAAGQEGLARRLGREPRPGAQGLPRGAAEHAGVARQAGCGVVREGAGEEVEVVRRPGHAAVGQEGLARRLGREPRPGEALEARPEVHEDHGERSHE